MREKVGLVGLKGCPVDCTGLGAVVPGAEVISGEVVDCCSMWSCHIYGLLAGSRVQLVR